MKFYKTFSSLSSLPAVQLITASPELSHRLFGLASNQTAGTTTLTLDTQNVPSQQQQQQQQHEAETKISTSVATTTTATALTSATQTPLITVVAAAVKRLPGLKVRAITQPQLQYQQQMQEQQNNQNSLLKLQLRSGQKEIPSDGNGATIDANDPLESGAGNDPCAALQSLATVAERQAPNAIQPPSANNLQRQFLLHMATNPIPKNTQEFLQKQQQQQQQQQETEDLTNDQSEEDQIHRIDDDDDDDDGATANLELILDSNDGKSDPEFILNDDIIMPRLECKKRDHNAAQGRTVGRERTRKSHNPSNPSKPIQRRRIRRKAQSTIDDQAEHLTEMSVRGLDLFRYASISEGVYQCTECAKENVQKTFKNKYSFQRHAFLYHEGKHRKVFPCLICGKEFSRPDKMKNHLKMTHDGFAGKDMSQFSALNYLINAAAVGDIQPQVYTTLPQRPEEPAPKAEQQLATSTEAGSNDGSPSGDASPPCEPALALMKLQNDIIIKDELVISPSPSPPPPSQSPQPTAPMVVIARGSRLEEVK